MLQRRRTGTAQLPWLPVPGQLSQPPPVCHPSATRLSALQFSTLLPLLSAIYAFSVFTCFSLACWLSAADKCLRYGLLQGALVMASWPLEAGLIAEASRKQVPASLTARDQGPTSIGQLRFKLQPCFLRYIGFSH